MARAPIPIRLTPVYEYGLAPIAEREGIPLGTLLRRIVEEWAQAYTRDQCASVGAWIRSSEEGAALTAFADTALEDMLTMEERFTAPKAAGT
jgi:hypothetical protein